MKQTQKGNVAIIIMIVVIVAITTGISAWMFAKKSQVQTQQAGMTQPITPVAQTQQPDQSVATTIQSTDETASWQTYSNAKLGFEFKHPKDWKQDTDDQTVNYSEISFYAPKNDGDYWKGDFSIYVNVANNLSTSDINNREIQIKNIDAYDKTTGSYVKEISFLGGNAIKRFDVQSPQAPANTSYFLKRGNATFELTYLTAKNTDGIGEKIISTFKFTK